MNIIFISSIIIFGYSTSAQDCLSIQASLSQKVENEGFHRKIRWLLEVTHPKNEDLKNNKCSFVLHLEVPSGAFVNPDQLASLNRKHILYSFLNDSVDVELAEHEAGKHNVFAFLQVENFERVTLELPIHLRYQRAQIGGGFGKVILPKPSLLVRCSQKIRKLCQQNNFLGPCDYKAATPCRWKNITYTPLFENAELLVPLGNLDDYPIVSIVSLLIGCVGCIYILSVLTGR